MLKQKSKKEAQVIVAKEDNESDLQTNEEPIKAQFIGTVAYAKEDYEKALVFYNKGSFGELQGTKQKRIAYSLEEALYLVERGRLDIYEGKRKLTFDQLLKKLTKQDNHFWTRYCVYKDIRTRGYVTKTALKFGADFRVYRRGVKPGEDHAKWVLYAMGENDKVSSSEFAARNRVAHSTRKKLLMGIADAEGDVTYYEIRWTKP